MTSSVLKHDRVFFLQKTFGTRYAVKCQQCFVRAGRNSAAYLNSSMLQSSVTRCNFSCNLFRNGVARQVAGRLQRVTFPLCNLACYFFGLATIEHSCYRVQFFLQRVLQHLKKKLITSFKSHVTHCNLKLQLAMVSKQSMQSLQKIEPSSTISQIMCTKFKFMRSFALQNDFQ